LRNLKKNIKKHIFPGNNNDLMKLYKYGKATNFVYQK